MAYDAHLHLDSYPADRREGLLAEAFEAGVDGIVAVSMDPASCRTNRELAARYPGRIIPAYGHHPEQPPLPEAELAALCSWIRGLAAAGELFAIGEVGLPYYLRTEVEQRAEQEQARERHEQGQEQARERHEQGQEHAGEGQEQAQAFDEAPYLAQLDVFVALAAELGRPIALHAVYEDADKAMDLLEKHGVRLAHFHWFKGGPETVARLIEGGYYVSLTPDVLYEADIRELAAILPLDRLMAETDGPWPFEGPFAGSETVPAMVRAVSREIAQLRGLEPEVVEKILERNTRQLYGFPEPPQG